MDGMIDGRACRIFTADSPMGIERKPDRDIFSNNISWSQPEYLDFCPRCYERIRQFVVDQRDTGTMA